MAKDKVNVADLVELLSQQLSLSKKAADDFLKALLATIEDTLMSQENVKIKGLGTFKLQWNEPRKSVDVNTGVEIIIEGYHKVVFSPDAELKELANEPYAHLQPVPLDDEEEEKQPASPQETVEANQMPLKYFDEQANEIKDILSEINAIGKRPEEEVVNEEVVNEEVVEEEVVEEEAVDEESPEPVLASPEDEVIGEVKLPEIETTTEDIIEEPKFLSANNQLKKPKKFSSTRKSNNLDFIFIGMMLGGLLIYLIIDFDVLSNLQNLIKSSGTQHHVYQPVSDDYLFSDAIVDDNISPDAGISEQDNTIAETPVVATEQQDVLQQLFDQPRVYEEFIATEEVIPGSRLTRIAERHYGVKEFWVYIYEANQDLFSSPDEIEPGMVLKIPKLNPVLADVNNPRCMEYALKLHDIYLNQ